MTPARLQTIEEIYRAALDREPDQISAFLDTACEGDELLRDKVEALLASRERAGNFIETSAVGVTTKIIQDGQADLLVGRTIGHYKISKRIGTGGMGDVYLATDIAAGRKAALKLLPMRFTGDAERLKRFQQEARAVVGLNHPNILTIYEIGEDHSTHYIASELIEGETLRQRLVRGQMQVREAVEVAIQVASALAAAHETGIVHRDIKPENIMLRPDGYVKVLDFGIAKLAESAFAEATADGAGSMTLAETNLGSILGTVRYMSPEQACPAVGGIDKTTDIWSLGVVLYEMVTGHVPFTGDPPSQSYGAAGTPQEVMSSILEREPPPLTNYITHPPAELQQIISKTLRKDREERYHSAHELLQALKDLRRKLEAEFERAAAPLWLRWARSPAALVLGLTIGALALALPFYWQRRLTTSPPPEKSIAVLPLQNLSEDKENAFFADGVQDELLSNLSKIKDLKVISRTSVMQYKTGTKRNLKEIAQQLGVSNVVEGSVRRSGDHVRVSVQLIDARTDRHLWGENYDRTLADSVSLQGELATDIADAVGATLSPQEKAAVQATPTKNTAAYDAYLRGRALAAGFTGDFSNLEGAAKSYQDAVTLDPSFALAWVYLSSADSSLYWTGVDPTPARLAAAKDALDRAVALDPNLPEIHLAIGYYHFYGLRDFQGSLEEFRLAEKSLPNDVGVLRAIGLIQRRFGHWDETIGVMHRVFALDPRNIDSAAILVVTYTAQRRFSDAMTVGNHIFAVEPSNTPMIWGKTFLFWAMGNLGAADSFLATSNPPVHLRGHQAFIKRQYPEAADLFSKALKNAQGEEKRGLLLDLGLVQQHTGNVAASKAAYQGAVQEFTRALSTAAADGGPAAELHSQLGLAYAGLGDAPNAVSEGKKGMAMQPTSEDLFEGPLREEQMAQIYALLGNADEAIPILKRWVQVPSATSITPALLRIDPIWDSIRNDPRFQELVAEKKP